MRLNLLLGRLEVEKVVQDQVSLESKGVAILSVSLCFACIAMVKVIMERVGMAGGGWILVLMFCSMTMLIPVLYG